MPLIAGPDHLTEDAYIVSRAAGELLSVRCRALCEAGG